MRESNSLGLQATVAGGLAVVQAWSSFVSAGFGDRLLSEVKKLAPKDVKIKVGLRASGQGAGWADGTPAGPVAHSALCPTTHAWA